MGGWRDLTIDPHNAEQKHRSKSLRHQLGQQPRDPLPFQISLSSHSCCFINLGLIKPQLVKFHRHQASVSPSPSCLHRLLCKKLWSKGIRIWSGCRSSGSLPVKPRALTLLGPTAALWIRWLFRSFSQYAASFTLPFHSSLRRNRKCKTCSFSVHCSLR